MVSSECATFTRAHMTKKPQPADRLTREINWFFLSRIPSNRLTFHEFFQALLRQVYLHHHMAWHGLRGYLVLFALKLGL